jgi:predicted DNA-binding transcriptional regulator YafY
LIQISAPGVEYFLMGAAIATLRATEDADFAVTVRDWSAYDTPRTRIFAGRKVQWAVLRFTPERARYVALEEWHPKQKVRWEEDGSYVLEVPFTSAIELLKDVLAFGPDVEVVSPPELRAEAMSRLEKARARYRR